MKEWKDADHKVSYYYLTDTGRIVGQIYNLAHTNIYAAKVLNQSNEELYLGQYITSQFAKFAVEYYWNVQERTLPFENNS